MKLAMFALATAAFVLGALGGAQVISAAVERGRARGDYALYCAQSQPSMLDLVLHEWAHPYPDANLGKP